MSRGRHGVELPEGVEPNDVLPPAGTPARAEANTRCPHACESCEDDDPSEGCSHCNGERVIDWGGWEQQDRGYCMFCPTRDIPVTELENGDWICLPCLVDGHRAWNPECERWANLEKWCEETRERWRADDAALALARMPG